ncbi:MAG: metallophosphoesterase family protein [Nanoarchaeota archaeon]
MENSNKRKTKILAAADIHGDTGLVKKLAKKAKDENVDIVILAGDLTLAETKTQNLIGPFVKNKKPVLIIPGNHESQATHNFLSEMYAPYLRNIHGYSFSKEDLGIFGAGSAEIGIQGIRDIEIFNLLENAHKQLPKNIQRKIMVTHMHPRKSKAEFSGFKGSESIRKAMKKFSPDILLNAHIHEAEGIEEKIGKTRVMNIGRRGKVFEI